MKRFLLFFIMGISSTGFSQTLNDGVMMPRKAICTGFMYSYDQWTDYWEGELKRDNENIGTLTTRSLMWVGSYGLTDKINIVAMVPYVWTEASQGVLNSMKGIQDLTLGAKYNFFAQDIGSGAFKTFASFAYSRPLSNYTPDFLPLSIGLATQNLSYRLTLNYALTMGIYVNASGAYTWRSNTTLDRPTHYTNGQMYMTDEVKMYNVSDYVINVGYRKGNIQADLNFVQQNTLGGGDIRRQDMPFVSNRMNFSKAGAFVMYQVPKSNGLGVRVGGSLTLDGRNVGKSTTIMSGLLYTLDFSPKQ